MIVYREVEIDGDKGNLEGTVGDGVEVSTTTTTISYRADFIRVIDRGDASAGKSKIVYSRPPNDDISSVDTVTMHPQIVGGREAVGGW